MNPKPWYESRTVWVNAITLIVAVAAIIAGADWISPKTGAIISGTVIPILNVFLRFITNQPLKPLTGE